MYAQEQVKQQYVGATLGGSAGVYDAANQRQRELPMAIDAMERAANFLHDSVNELGSRLDGLLRPAAPEPVGTAQIQAAPPSSGYASTIHSQAAIVTMLADRVQDLLRRLEA